MDAKLINLADYEYTGEGANGESYNLKGNSAVMMKLYNSKAPADGAASELAFARKVYEAGIPTPRPGELVTDGNGRYGIQYERIVGKKSYARATSDDFDNVEKYGREFGAFCRELHQIHLPKSDFPDAKEKYLGFLDVNHYFSEDEKSRVRAFIQSIPDSDIANHGDLQYGNAIRVEDGDTVRKYFIDLGDFAVGHPYMDLGQVLLTCRYENPQFSVDVFHLTVEQAGEFWKYFVKGYWGEDADPEYWDSVIRPYAGLKVLLIQHFSKSPFPAYKKLLMDSI